MLEVAELVEHFQWLTEESSQHLEADKLDEVADEIADVQLYLIRLADKLGVDILKAVEQKIVKNEAKYPVDKVRGSSEKYTKYTEDDNKQWLFILRISNRAWDESIRNGQ